jgi:hypothetical protein
VIFILIFILLILVKSPLALPLIPLSILFKAVDQNLRLTYQRNHQTALGLVLRSACRFLANISTPLQLPPLSENL